MCGIFCYFTRKGHEKDRTAVINAAMKTQHRGPDATHLIHGRWSEGTAIDRYHLVFHRLTVNGLSPESGQPLCYPIMNPTTYLLCNGEIYNYRELITQYDITDYHSGSDCEIILHLYAKYRQGYIRSLEQMVGIMQGEFAFVLLDFETDTIIMGRDPLGVRSMYYSSDSDGYGFCSELKSLYPLADPESIKQFPAGCYGVMNLKPDVSMSISRYFDVNRIGYIPDPFSVNDKEQIIKRLQFLMTQAVKRRLMCDRVTADGSPAIGAFLSGGFDSSMIAGLLAKLYPGKLHTFSIGFKDAPDLLAARQVAAYIGSQHHEVIVTEDEMLQVLQRVTETIESYDVTTNRASAFMLRLSEYVRDNTDIIVIYSGEVSDELFGSYMYFHNAPDAASFHAESLRLMRDLQYYDLLRGDKASAAAGLEIRVPIADEDLLEFVIRIPTELKMAARPGHTNRIEKYIIREAVSRMGIIPESICWRTKEAMSDGVSLHTRSWSSIIQEMACKELKEELKELDPVEAERQWFMMKFKQHYNGCEGTIPYYWLPKWCGDVKDASARVLDVYQTQMASSS